MEVNRNKFIRKPVFFIILYSKIIKSCMLIQK